MNKDNNDAIVSGLIVHWLDHTQQSDKPLTRGFLPAKKIAGTGSLHFSVAKSCCTAVGGRTLKGSKCRRHSRLILSFRLVSNTNRLFSRTFLATSSIANTVNWEKLRSGIWLSSEGEMRYSWTLMDEHSSFCFERIVSITELRSSSESVGHSWFRDTKNETL